MLQGKHNRAVACLQFAPYALSQDGFVRFEPTRLDNVMVVEPDLNRDIRGFFSRTFCFRQFEENGLPFDLVEVDIECSNERGVVRGFHFDTTPGNRHRVVRCTRGSAHYVVIDLRQQSATHLEHFAIELSDVNRRILYVGPGFALGWQALSSGAEIACLTTEVQTAGGWRGCRYDDPAFHIRWPITVTGVSDPDRSWPPFDSVSAIRGAQATACGTSCDDTVLTRG
jgi:dTDP-4-dehydrorhamnose 3,5-epimerase